MIDSSDVIDLRSDTVTTPTPEMRQAMATADVGDDQYGEDPTVARLERRAAELIGKEAAVYVPSGTMGNLAAVLAHCGRGDEAILGDESHIFWFESGGVATLGGIPFHLLRTNRWGQLALEDVARAIRIKRAGYPRTGVVCIENTHNRCNGVALPISYLQELKTLAHERGVPVHMDGARIFNAAAALGVDARDLAAEVDSVQFCLSKGLGAPVGSLVAGSTAYIENVRRQRKLLGGAMRQSGVIAAAGLVALETMRDRLTEDHRRAQRLADALAAIPGVGIDRETMQSNIILFHPPAGQDPAEVVGALAARGLKVSNYGDRGLRMVTHHQIDDAKIDRACETLMAVMTRNPVSVSA